MISPRYRLKQPILAVLCNDSRKSEGFVYVPAEAVVSRVQEDCPDQQPLVRVHWDGQTVLMFEQDLHSRATRVPEPLSFQACAA